MVSQIRDIQVAGGIYGHAGWRGEFRAGGRDIVAVIAKAPVSGYRGDRSARHFADAAVAGVRDEDIAG